MFGSRKQVRRGGLVGGLIGVLALSTVSIPSAQALDFGLGGMWTMNEGAGQYVYDWSGNGNHGVRGSTSDAEATDPEWLHLSGWFLNRRAALRFDGNDFVTVTDSASLEPEQITVAARVRATGSPGVHRYVVAKGALKCEAASYGLYTGAGGGLSFYVSDGAEVTLSPDAGEATWDGQWHDVIGTFDGATVRLYVDGVEVGSGSPTTVSIAYGLPDDDRLYIGDYGGECAATVGFVGDIDAVAVARKAIVPQNLLGDGSLTQRINDLLNRWGI